MKTDAVTVISNGMIGAVVSRFSNLCIRLGLRKARPVSAPIAPATDDFVARHGLSYGEAADPISKEAHFQIERLKCWPRNRR